MKFNIKSVEVSHRLTALLPLKRISLWESIDRSPGKQRPLWFHEGKFTTISVIVTQSSIPTNPQNLSPCHIWPNCITMLNSLQVTDQEVSPELSTNITVYGMPLFCFWRCHIYPLFAYKNQSIIGKFSPYWLIVLFLVNIMHSGSREIGFT